MKTEYIFALISLVVSLLGAAVSWYYAKESRKASKQAMALKEQQMVLLVEQRNHQYLTEACEAFQKEGTPYHYIDALSLGDDEKENLWQATFVRHKQRSPKRNFLEEKATKKK